MPDALLNKLTQELRVSIPVNEVITGPQDRLSLIAYKAVLTDDFPIPEIDKILTTHAPSCFDEYGFRIEVFSATLFKDDGLSELKNVIPTFFIDNYFKIVSMKELSNEKRGGLICECVGENTGQSVVIAMSWIYVEPVDLERFKDDQYLHRVTEGGHLLTCTVLWENEP